MILKILPSALDDLRDGWQFYEEQSEGLGDYFQNSLFSDIDSLLLYAGIHRTVFGFHRLLSHRFPYAIYYRIADSQTVVVWRVLDLRRDPESITTELREDRTRRG